MFTKDNYLFSVLFTVSFYIVAELASIKLMRQVPLNEPKHKIDKPPKFYKTENRFYNESYISNFELKTMKDSIINHKELQCEPLKGRQTNPLQALLDSKVNQRTSKCTHYVNSLFKVLYPKGMNSRKK